MGVKEKCCFLHALTDRIAVAVIDGIAIGVLLACAIISIGCGWIKP